MLPSTLNTTSIKLWGLTRKCFYEGGTRRRGCFRVCSAFAQLGFSVVTGWRCRYRLLGSAPADLRRGAVLFLPGSVSFIVVSPLCTLSDAVTVLRNRGTVGVADTAAGGLRGTGL